MEYDKAWYESKWQEEISLKAEKFEKKQYKVEEKWVKSGYIEVFLSVSSLENSTNRGSDILLVKKIANLPYKTLSPSDLIKYKNSD